MSEAGYVELPVIAWLSGHGSHAPGDMGLGWTYRDEAAIATFNRPLTDPLVEPLLIQAILDIQDGPTLEVHYLRDKVPLTVNQAGVERRLRADVRGNGTGGRGSQGPDPAPARADHSKRFWLTVQSLCPDTERARQWLCANGASLYLDFALGA